MVDRSKGGQPNFGRPFLVLSVSRGQVSGAERFSEVPECFVEPDVFVEAADGAGAGVALAILFAAGIVLDASANDVLLNAVVGAPKIGAGVFGASGFEKFDGAYRGRLEVVVFQEDGGFGKGFGFGGGKLAGAESFDFVGELGQGVNAEQSAYT